MTPKVYAIVVTYNGKKWLNMCLGSLRNSTLPVHTIVIDNASTDDTVINIKGNFPEVELIESRENLGFGKGNNIGLKKAMEESADYVLLLNQDAWVAEDCLKKLVNVFNTHMGYGIISPVHMESNNNRLEYHFSTYISPNNCTDFLSDSYKNKFKPVYTTKFVNAACWLISSSCLKEVGGFDPLFPHYGEDEDYVNRIHYYRYKIGVTPAAIAWHDIAYKKWDEIFWNPDRQRIFAYIELKNINASFRSNLFLYIKRTLDSLSTFILVFRFDKAWHIFKILISVLLDLRRIKASRKICKQKKAYII